LKIDKNAETVLVLKIYKKKTLVKPVWQQYLCSVFQQKLIDKPNWSEPGFLVFTKPPGFQRFFNRWCPCISMLLGLLIQVTVE
jgi:hypothetical protein